MQGWCLGDSGRALCHGTAVFEHLFYQLLHLGVEQNHSHLLAVHTLPNQGDKH